MNTQEPSRQEGFADSYIPQSEQALRPIFPFLADFVRRRIPVDLHGRTVLDLGGGTGQWLLALMERGLGSGILLDEDAAMVAHARRAAAATSPPVPLLILLGRAEHIPLRNGVVDLVVSRNSMHLWHDLARAWHEIGRILAPGGWAFLGRGFGPDLPEEVRLQVKQARQALRNPQEPPPQEPPSPEPSTVDALARQAGVQPVAIVPDHHSWWFLGQRLP
ncbi:MAG: class I SAM-dependent methyltransferase [Candidatus Riflebacteria bacterium]|nr:class I SAM-dependent methyltransferase [Candidatus Riflebacteria bacterium]